jgi:hypothetical protein
MQIRKNIIALIDTINTSKFNAGTWVHRLEYKSFTPEKINKNESIG